MARFVERDMGGGSGGNYEVDSIYCSTCSMRTADLVTGRWENLEMRGEKIGKKIRG